MARPNNHAEKRAEQKFAHSRKPGSAKFWKRLTSRKARRGNRVRLRANVRGGRIGN